MKGTITFSRESLDRYKAECESAKSNGATSFVWKGSLNDVNEATRLIEKLEKSPNLSIPI